MTRSYYPIIIATSRTHLKESRLIARGIKLYLIGNYQVKMPWVFGKLDKVQALVALLQTEVFEALRYNSLMVISTCAEIGYN